MVSVVPNQTKKCWSCKETKLLAEFGANKTKSDGYHDTCRPCKKVHDRDYYLRNRERRIAQAQAYVDANPERRKRYVKAYYAENRDVQLAGINEWREQNRERHRRYAREYKSAHRQQYNVTNARRRARQKNAAINDFTHAQWLELLAEHSNRCAYCREEKPLTQDHVVPLSRGGNHTKSNIVPACQSCNSHKHNKLLEELAA